MDIDHLQESLLSGERRALAKAITLIESQLADDRAAADRLLQAIMPYTGKAKRIGISGPPGAGKSSFIEKIGPILIGNDKKLAVLAIDPTSPLTGGSILGDKTRMVELASHARVFIRPSPGGRQGGGIAERTAETLLLCEAAGHDWVIVETIGVGQSEVAVAEMTDMFLALLAPGGGDDLQGIKRGIMELADLFLITKADGALMEDAARMQAALDHSLPLLRPRRETWRVKALLSSIYDAASCVAIAAEIENFFNLQKPYIAGERQRQLLRWFELGLKAELERAFLSNCHLQHERQQAEITIAQGKALPITEARRLARRFFKKN